VIEKIGGASRARTDDLIVANDEFTGYARFSFQSLASFASENSLSFLERIWNVRKPVRFASNKPPCNREEQVIGLTIWQIGKSFRVIFSSILGEHVMASDSRLEPQACTLV